MVARNIESIEHSSVAPIRSHMHFSGLCLLHLLLVWTDSSFVHAWIKAKKGVEYKEWKGTGSWGYERERWWWSDDRGRKGRPWFEAIAHVCVHVASFCPASFSVVCARPFLVSSACSSGSNIGACVRVLCAKDKLGMMDERSWGTPVCRYDKWRPPSPVVSSRKSKMCESFGGHPASSAGSRRSHCVKCFPCSLLAFLSLTSPPPIPRLCWFLTSPSLRWPDDGVLLTSCTVVAVFCRVVHVSAASFSWRLEWPFPSRYETFCCLRTPPLPLF